MRDPLRRMRDPPRRRRERGREREREKEKEKKKARERERDEREAIWKHNETRFESAIRSED